MTPAGDVHSQRRRSLTLVSVIIPALKAEDTIGAQLVAPSAQTRDNAWEVVIADNGSSDNTVEAARNHLAGIPKLRIVDASDARGAAHARNVATPGLIRRLHSNS